MIAYEELLNRDRGWALDQGGLHFEGKSAVQQTLRAIAHRLDELGVAYPVAEVGSVAMREPFSPLQFTTAQSRQLHSMPLPVVLATSSVTSPELPKNRKNPHLPDQPALSQRY